VTLLTLDNTNAGYYYKHMIVDWKCNETEKIWKGTRSRKLPSDIQQVARRKLRMLDAAQALEDCKVPPGNRLEALSGKRKGQHSIRINDQWRICFVWVSGNVKEVEIVDYH